MVESTPGEFGKEKQVVSYSAQGDSMCSKLHGIRIQMSLGKQISIWPNQIVNGKAVAPSSPKNTFVRIVVRIDKDLKTYPDTPFRLVLDSKNCGQTALVTDTGLKYPPVLFGSLTGTNPPAEANILTGTWVNFLFEVPKETKLQNLDRFIFSAIPIEKESDKATTVSLYVPFKLKK
jgi:hypothetical protein